MATDTSLLQGEVIDDPEGQERDVERLLVGFVRALMDEQRNVVSEVTGAAAPEVRSIQKQTEIL